MSLAKALKKAASASLKKLGGDVTIRQVTAGAYNTTTGAITESTSDTTIKGALSNVSKNQVNDLIESQDKLLTISAGDLTFAPTTKDRVVISSVEFKIIQVIVNEQNNTPVSFDLILRYYGQTNFYFANPKGNGAICRNFGTSNYFRMDSKSKKGNTSIRA